MHANHRMSRHAAEDFIRNVDHDRERRVRSMYGVDVEDPSLYDLTVNLRSLSLDSSCAAIAEAAAQPAFRVTDEGQGAPQAFAAECRQRLEEALRED